MFLSSDVDKILFIFLIVQSILIFLGFIVIMMTIFPFFARSEKNKKVAQRKVNFENFFSELKNVITFFSRNYIGALIVFKGKKNLDYKFASMGLVLNCEFTSEIVKNIFSYKMSQLHDGAIVLNSNFKIYSAQAYVEISKKKKTFKEFGLRHNAAYSVVADCEAIALVVSEKDGAVTLFINKNTRFKNLEWDKMKKIIENWHDEQTK